MWFLVVTTVLGTTTVHEKSVGRMSVDSKLDTSITDAQNITAIIASASSVPLATKMRILATTV